MSFRLPVTPYFVNPWSRFRFWMLKASQKWRILIRRSGLGEGNNFRHFAVPLDLTFEPGFAIISQRVTKFFSLFGTRSSLPHLHDPPRVAVLIQLMQPALSHVVYFRSSLILFSHLQGGSNMTGTNCDLFTHNSTRSYLNHLVPARSTDWSR
jgi:hypothetical protein